MVEERCTFSLGFESFIFIIALRIRIYLHHSHNIILSIPLVLIVIAFLSKSKDFNLPVLAAIIHSDRIKNPSRGEFL